MLLLLQDKIYALLSESQSSSSSSNKETSLKSSGSRLQMAQCVQRVLEREEFWAHWKENKCATNFEREPSNQIANVRKRDMKQS